VTASAASAASHHFVAQKGTLFDGEALGAQKIEKTTGEGKGFQCAKVSLTGEVIEEPQKEVTVVPKYEECQTFGETVTTAFIEPGCHYVLKGVTTTGNPTLGEHANVKLQCTAPATHTETRVTALKLKCSSVPTQEIEHAVRYENQTTADGKTHIKMIVTATASNRQQQKALRTAAAPCTPTAAG
jgi:hypothetical protein